MLLVFVRCRVPVLSAQDLVRSPLPSIPERGIRSVGPHRPDHPQVREIEHEHQGSRPSSGTAKSFPIEMLVSFLRQQHVTRHSNDRAAGLLPLPQVQPSWPGRKT